MHTVIYSSNARKDLKRLEQTLVHRVIEKIAYFSEQKDPLHYAKKLNNNELGEYRFRIGEYRAIFDVDTKGRLYILMILRIKHRKDIYQL